MTTSTANPNHLNPIQRFFASIATTRFGTWLIRDVATRIDPPLMRATRGRLNFGRLVGIRIALLTTTGAKSGQPRTVPLLYFEDAGRLVFIGSNVGMTFHPGWVYNIRADPRVTVTIDGQARSYTASEAPSPERERLWAAAESIYAGFRQYERRAGSRHIPVFVLEPDEG